MGDFATPPDTTTVSEALARPAGEMLAVMRALNQVSNALALTPSIEALCRVAVELGRSQLGFDRLSFWRVGDEPFVLTGTVGTDEAGGLRDEHDAHVSAPNDSIIWQLLSGGARRIWSRDVPLYDEHSRVVGRGDHLAAAVWDDVGVVGCLFADNLLSKQPFTRMHAEVLELYAATIGHLYALKTTEAALRAGEARVQTALAGTRIGIWDWHVPTGQVQFIRHWAEILGYPPEQIVDHLSMWQHHVHPDDRAWVESQLQAHLAGQTPEYETVHRLRAFSGDYRWILDRGRVVMRDEAGQPVRAVGVHLDITEQKTAELALREQHRFVQQLIDTIPVPLFVKDCDGHYIECNSAFCAFLGVPREQVLQRTVFEVAPETLANGYREKDDELLRRGGAQVYEGQVRHADGTVRPVAFHKAAFTREDGALGGITGIIIDLSERKAAEAREQQLRQMEEASRLRGQFLSCISHELKTPLTPIMGALELLNDKVVGELTSRQQDAVAMAQRQAARMHRLVNDLLDLFQLEHGHLSLRLDTVVLPVLVADSVAAFTPRYQERELSLTVEVDDAIPPITGDAQRLGQVLDNLLENALKYTDTGGVVLRLRHTGRMVLVEVQDTGVGLNPEDAALIFDPFFQVEQAQRKGLGLGLAIVKHLIESHGGQISVHSAGRGQGTTFRVMLPV